MIDVVKNIKKICGKDVLIQKRFIGHSLSPTKKFKHIVKCKFKEVNFKINPRLILK